MSSVVQPFGSPWSIYDLPAGTDTDLSTADISTWDVVPAPVGGYLGAYTGTEDWLPIVTSRPIGTPSTAFWLAIDVEDRLLSVELRMDADVRIYHNGHLIASLLGPSNTTTVWGPQLVPLPREPGRLALLVQQHVRAGGDGLYVDAQVNIASLTPAVRQFPRDDAAGLGASSRLYPPPKSLRTVGGYQ